METLNLQNDLKVFGKRVTNFPVGVKEAFDELIKTLPEGDERPYYGISECINGNIIYVAAALETYEGEAKKYGYESYIIESGQYSASTLTDWTSKTHCIKDVFQEILKDERVDKTKPAIEVYKNVQEMVCMVKVDERREMITEFDNAMNDMFTLLSSLDNEELNIKPSVEKWSAGQVADHVIQSHAGFAQLINGRAKDTERDPREWVAQIENDFADMSIKMDSPSFVWPESEVYRKEEILEDLARVNSAIEEAIRTVDLKKTCSLFELPVYGYLTRTEAIWFVISHTKRHLHQLENITSTIACKMYDQ